MGYHRPGSAGGMYYIGSTIIKPNSYHKVVWPEKYKIGDQQVYKI